MRFITIIATLVIVLMSISFINVAVYGGFNHGVGIDTFLAGASNPWQLFINNDLVSGLALVACWIWFRESGSPTLAIVAWLWMLIFWGNIVAATYLLWAAYRADGDCTVFFMGRRAPGYVAASSWGFSPAARIFFAAAAVVTIGFVVVGLAHVHWASLASLGYISGFGPAILSFVLLARSRQTILPSQSKTEPL